MAVLDGLPDVGLVSGFYLRATHPKTAQLASDKGLDVTASPANEEWLDEFCRDASYESHEAYYKAQEWQGWTDLEDRIITKDGLRAYAGGICWQAVFKKETLMQLLPDDDPKLHRWPSYDGYFHSQVIEKGYLRLSTTDRVVRHIGNVITPEMSDLAREHGIDADATVADYTVNGKPHLLLRFGPSYRIAKRVSNYLYKQVKGDVPQ